MSGTSKDFLNLKLSSQSGQILMSMHEGDGFSVKTLGKSCFVKMTGPAMVRPARSDLESDLNLVLIASQCTGPVQGDKSRWSLIS